MIDINKINSIEEAEGLIAEQEAKKQEAYTEIGKLYYVKHSVDAESDFKPFIDELVEASGAIAECNRRILMLKGMATCPECGANVREGSLFCTGCGALLKKEEAQPEPAPVIADTVFCTRCGSEMKKNMRFCTVCGNPMIDEAPAPVAEATKQYSPSVGIDPAPVPAVEPVPVIAPVPAADPVPVPLPEPEPVPVPEPEPEPAPVPAPAPVTKAFVPQAPEPAPAEVPKYDVKKDRFAVPEPSTICPMCGKISAPGMRFCVACGANLFEDPAPAPMQDYGVRRCPECGHISANPSLPFCTECGARLD